MGRRSVYALRLAKYSARRGVARPERSLMSMNALFLYVNNYYRVIIMQSMGCEAQLAGLKMSIHAHFWMVLEILTSKIGQKDLGFGFLTRVLVGLCMQDYKPLCLAVTICAIMVNIPADTHLVDGLA